MTIDITTITQHANNMVRAQETENYMKKYGNGTIVIYQIGDYYKAYGESADRLTEIMKELPLIENGISTYEFKKSYQDILFPRIISKGYKIAVLES